MPKKGNRWITYNYDVRVLLGCTNTIRRFAFVSTAVTVEEVRYMKLAIILRKFVLVAFDEQLVILNYEI